MMLLVITDPKAHGDYELERKNKKSSQSTLTSSKDTQTSRTHQQLTVKTRVIESKQ